MKGLPELTLEQKNEFLDYTIPRYKARSGSCICGEFRDWYNDEIKSQEFTNYGHYALTAFPELLITIQRRLRYQGLRANVHHDIKSLDFRLLREGEQDFYLYRMKLLMRVQDKINDELL